MCYTVLIKNLPGDVIMGDQSDDDDDQRQYCSAV